MGFNVGDNKGDLRFSINDKRVFELHLILV